ncbi:ATP-dependent DNA ligase [Heliorestis convoluta]|uniref:DNA ligase (ATP) n=1 Tax=Heliorestis convoluta TaxID=356322 RepID=A0A5Q2N3R7_9FIRM|nr:ATP-dependent DNA ligase [Heliorestis convoluta]QGG47225.1 Hypothetical protein FTV88_1073 [Heliorestis convoluta]
MTYLLPMEPQVATAPFDHPDYLFQIKWDGIRCLATITEEGMMLRSRNGKDMSKQFPEIVNSPFFSSGRSKTIVDGELVVLDRDGLPSFPLVLKRHRFQKASSIEEGRKVYPVLYMIFDLLQWQNQSFLEHPLEKRLAKLERELVPSNHIVFTKAEEAAGIAFFQSIQKLNLEGMVGKDRNSLYRPGKKARTWKKVKNFRQLSCFVIGFTQSQEGQIASLALGLPLENTWQYIGKVGTGISQKEARLWYVRLHPQQMKESTTEVKKQGYHKVHQPYPIIVQYLEWTQDLRLRHPSLLSTIEP